jgi:hypothetical protein
MKCVQFLLFLNFLSHQVLKCLADSARIFRPNDCSHKLSDQAVWNVANRKVSKEVVFELAIFYDVVYERFVLHVFIFLCVVGVGVIVVTLTMLLSPCS